MQLYQGDCLEAIKGIPAGTVDLVLTDPPYGIMDFEWDNAVEPSVFFEAVARVLRRGGRLVCFSQEPYTSELICKSIGELRFNYKCAWIKNRSGNSKSAKTAMVSVIEDILVFTEIGRCKRGSSAIEAVREFVDRVGKESVAMALMKTGRYCNMASAVNNVRKKCDCGDRNYYNFFSADDLRLLNEEIGLSFSPEWYLQEAQKTKEQDSPVFHLWEGKKSKRNALVYDCPSRPVHPTQKPVPLLADLIKTFSNEGDMVLDCFMGSGSTGVACINTGRDFIGIELNQGYFETAKRRMEEAQAQMVM